MKKYEVSWYEDDNQKVLGPYTFSQAIKFAQKIYKKPEVDHLRISEVTA